MNTASGIALNPSDSKPDSRRRKLLTDSFSMSIVGQLERLVGIVVTFSLRWGLTPSDLGIYGGLRILLDNTSRSSLGIALGAVQNRVILKAQGETERAKHLTDVAATANTLTSGVYGLGLVLWGLWLIQSLHENQWGFGLIVMGILAVLKRRQDYQIAIMRSDGEFQTVSRLAVIQNLVFALCMVIGISLAGFWGLIAGLSLGFLLQGLILDRTCPTLNFARIWDAHSTFVLALAGLPILAANSTWAMLSTLDRALILTHMQDGSLQAGYYSLAILATNWTSDVGGRVAMVLYPHYQMDVGKGATQSEILAHAEQAAMAMLMILTALSLIAFPLGNRILPLAFPGLVPGLAAFGPMLPGAVALAATWPMRQAWIAMNRPWVLAAAGGLIALIQYSLLRQACSGNSLGEIAMLCSLCQIMALTLMFSAGWVLSEWNRGRILKWAGFVALYFILVTALAVYGSIVSKTLNLILRFQVIQP